MLLLDLIVSLAANSVASRLFFSRNKILSFLSDAKPWPAFVLPWPNKVWCLNCFHTHSKARARTHTRTCSSTSTHTHTHTAPSLYHHAHKTRIKAQTNANTHSDTNTASYFSSLPLFLSLGFIKVLFPHRVSTQQ